MPLSFERDAFIDALREALAHLYDPYELKRNPLRTIVTRQMAEAGIDLKQVLINAINALMPDEHTPYDTKAWKIYELLNYRYIDQMDQKETAKNLLISLRTLQRLSPEAIESLAEVIASTYHISFSEPDAAIPWTAGETPPPHEDSWVDEIAFLKSQSSASMIDLQQMLKEITQILEPINQPGHKVIHIHLPDQNRLVLGQVTILRQAVLMAVSMFNQPGWTGGRIVVSSAPAGLREILTIVGPQPAIAPTPGYPPAGEEIPTALTNLMEILGGSVEIQHPSPSELCILLSLPVQQPYPILMVDDNADAIRLVEKYLERSLFQVRGVQEPEKVFAEIQKVEPSLILLDVMLPNVDGWMLLSQIRSNPNSQRLPVVVSTILPQESLSISLGADAFLRKPYTQQELLSVLETQIFKSRKQT